MSANLNLRKYDAAIRDYASDWALIRETLYKLCKEHPDHSHRASVNAKVLLIGRSFASGIERQVKSSGEAGSAISIVAEHMYKQRRAIDRIMSDLAAMAEPLTEEKLEVIVDCHGRLCSILRQVTARKNPPRSFVSKYLHFHCPLVPIFDSYAYDHVWRLCRGHADVEIRNCYKQPQARLLFKRKGVDGNYCCFALCFLQVYEALKTRRPHGVTVTLVDVALGDLVA